MAQQAERTSTFTQKRIDTNVAPVYIGPNIGTQDVLQGVLINPIETFGLFSGTNLVFTLEGPWPADLVIGAASGQVTGVVTDPVADYENLFIRTTNSKGFADSTQFTVSVTASVIAPVFDAGPIPDQIWQEGQVIVQFPMSQFFGGTLPITYTIETGALPDGLSMNTAGQINGTPTTDGTGSVSITGTNGAGADTTNVWGWTIWEAIVNAITIPAQTFPFNALYTHDMSQYFTGTITMWFLSPGWPAGFAIDANGVVTGTATVAEEVFPSLFITADNNFAGAVNSNTFTGTTAAEFVVADFYALTPDTANDYLMEGVLIGTGGLTTVHTADLYAKDVDDIFQKFPANARVWSEGRVVLTGAAGSDVVSVHGNVAPAGAALAEIPYQQYYPAATNIITFSRDLTQGGASWADTQANLAATFDQIGMLGEANSASLLDETNVSTSVARVQAQTILDDSNTHVGRLFIKKDSDITRFPALQLEVRNGSLQQVALQINTQTGATTIVSSIGTVDSEVYDGGDWWEVLVSVVNNTTGNDAARLLIYPAHGDVFGTGAGTAQGTCIVGNAELYLDTTIAKVRRLGPIFTTTAAVATDAPTNVFDSANSADTTSAWYMEVISEGALPILDGFLAVLGTDFELRDGTGTVTRPWTVSVLNQVGIVYDATTMAINVDGTYSADVAYDGTMLQGILDLFRAFSEFSAQIRELQRFDAADLAAAKAIINGLMAQTLVLTAGNQGQDVGYEAGSYGTLVPDNPRGFTINAFIERQGDVTLIVDGIQLMNIFDTIDIDGVIIDLALADTFGTGGGVSTWTFDATALTLVSSTVYSTVVKTK